MNVLRLIENKSCNDLLLVVLLIILLIIFLILRELVLYSAFPLFYIQSTNREHQNFVIVLYSLQLSEK